MKRGARGRFAVTVLAVVSGAAALARGEEKKGSDFAAALDEAVAQARSGDRAKAAEALLALAAEYPNSAPVYYNLGLTYEFDADGNRYKGDGLNAAASYYQAALKLDEGFTPARYNLAVVWHELGNLDAAAAEYRLVARAGGALARKAEYNLALIMKAQRRPQEGVAILERGQDYDDPARVRLLALLAEDVGDVGRAIALWKRALAVDDDPTLSALAVKHLQALRGY